MRINVKIQNMETCDKKLYSYITEMENLIKRMKKLNSVIDSKSYGKATTKIKNMIESYQHTMQKEKQVVAKMASVLESITVVYQNTENEAYKEIAGKKYKKVTRANNKVNAKKAKASTKKKYQNSKLKDALYKKKTKVVIPTKKPVVGKKVQPVVRKKIQPVVGKNKQGVPTGSVTMDKAMDWAIKTANNDKYEYRLGGGHGSGSKYHLDCSSFISKALQAAGIKVGTMTTENMQSTLTKAGFEWVPWSKVNSSKNLKSGDILLRRYIGSDGKWKGHTEMYIGNNQMVGAHRSPQYIVSGNKGVTGASSISVTQFDNKSWNGVLRYKGK